MSRHRYVIRHGQSTFNAAFAETGQDPMHFDARLSDLGHQQVAETRARVAELPRPDLIVCTPLTRAIQTTLGLFAGTTAPILVHALHRERCEHSCDVGRSPADLAADFPHLAFDHLDHPWWHDGPGHAPGVPFEPEDVFAARVAAFRAWLDARPEPVIVAVGHGEFFRRLAGRERIANCEIIRLDP